MIPGKRKQFSKGPVIKCFVNKLEFSVKRQVKEKSKCPKVSGRAGNNCVIVAAGVTFRFSQCQVTINQPIRARVRFN